MSKDISLDLQAIPEKTVALVHSFSRYSALLFLVLVAAVYAFLVLRINSLDNALPSSTPNSAQVTITATPHIDPVVVKQLKQLQDNSVRVKTLFDQARSNPFQE